MRLVSAFLAIFMLKCHLKYIKLCNNIEYICKYISNTQYNLLKTMQKHAFCHLMLMAQKLNLSEVLKFFLVFFYLTRIVH